ncbi:amidase [Nesterenkonia xinjiangensis]|uniref:Amidase n=1 Tax=Nesterenkonia xinjiangensis TaxID=225327 RepID=A0A7Z0GK31_9MICC|nr:amidase family protein [Nesterenkonia xinjiangensis]NYJ77425.1 amidase [Nesterenkonia xinjiangensis]
MEDLLEHGAARLVELIVRGELSSVELTRAHLAQIEEVNPRLNAVVTLEPERALQEARAADARRSRGEPAGLLHGLPMTHKDTHDVAGMRTTQGSPLFADHVPEADDPLIARLRRAGVVSTGKTNVPEFAAGSHTFNDVFGATGNPYDTTRSAGGSSGGVAAAVASRIQPLGEGSDMGGSLRNPACWCNIVGFRPSHGLMPGASPGNVEAWLGRSGPMARTVEDIALFMRAVVAGTSDVPGTPFLPPEAFLLTGREPRARDLAGVRVGVTLDHGLDVPVEPAMREALQRAAAAFEELGAEVVESRHDFTGADEVFRVTRALDFAGALGALVSDHRERIKPEVIWNVEQGLALTVEQILDARRLLARLRAATRSCFEQVDLLLSPGAQLAPFDVSLRWPEEVDGRPMEDYLDWMRSASILSAVGIPTLALPAGFDAEGLPTGVQLSADHLRDPWLLQCGWAYERATGWSSVAPGILRS